MAKLTPKQELQEALKGQLGRKGWWIVPGDVVKALYRGGINLAVEYSPITPRSPWVVHTTEGQVLGMFASAAAAKQGADRLIG